MELTKLQVIEHRLGSLQLWIDDLLDEPGFTPSEDFVKLAKAFKSWALTVEQEMKAAPESNDEPVNDTVTGEPTLMVRMTQKQVNKVFKRL